MFLWPEQNFRLTSHCYIRAFIYTILHLTVKCHKRLTKGQHVYWCIPLSCGVREPVTGVWIVSPSTGGSWLTADWRRFVFEAEWLRCTELALLPKGHEFDSDYCQFCTCMLDTCYVTESLCFKGLITRKVRFIVHALFYGHWNLSSRKEWI